MPRPRSHLLTMTVLALHLLQPGAHALTADSADDVCAPDADPCVVTEAVDVADGAILDFSTRALRVTGHGRFEFGSGNGRILCGPFEADTRASAIVAVGHANGGSASGRVTIEARRRCTAGAVNACLDDADCDPGTCTVGEASIVMNASMNGRSDDPASIRLEAADSVIVRGDVELSSTSIDSDGGLLVLEANGGDAILAGRVRARGGSEAQGGEVAVHAARDAVITGSMDLSGGDFDGGDLEVAARRDVLLNGSLDVSSRAGAGYGGAVTLDAGGDIRLGEASDRMRILLNGHASDDGFAGDAGSVDIVALGNAVIAPSVDIRAVGAKRDASGGSFVFSGDGAFEFSGRFQARARGDLGIGGTFDVQTIGDVIVGSEAVIDLRGGYGGTASLASAAGNSRVSGSLRLSGSSELETGTVEIGACRIAVGGRIENRVDGGQTTLIAYESMHLLPGSELLTPAGHTMLAYRAVEKPPILDGLVVREPVLSPQPAIGGCPVCGNSEIDEYEECDDGNVADGDGCSGSCRSE